LSEVRDLEKQLKTAVKTGKYVVGRREVLRSLKGSRILVWSASANLPTQILDQSRSLGIPAVKYGGNPVQLGRMCGIQFRVSVIAVKSSGDADLSSFSNSADYTSATGFQTVAQIPSKTETESIKKTAEVPYEEKQLKEQEGSEKLPEKTEKKKRGKEIQDKAKKASVEEKAEPQVIKKEAKLSRKKK